MSYQKRTRSSSCSRRHGYEVFQAADAESALELFEREKDRIDLVFSDVVLPGQDGVWLVEQLKQKRPGLEVRVITQSGVRP
ncbi:MAG: response regulator [Thermoleophilia bacterium]